LWPTTGFLAFVSPYSPTISGTSFVLEKTPVFC
jgi:hypothetical protein